MPAAVRPKWPLLHIPALAAFVRPCTSSPASFVGQALEKISTQLNEKPFL